jgi:hypothetical protein
MDYGTPERRKNRNDKKAKGRFNRFKTGGMHRTQNITITNNSKST